MGLEREIDFTFWLGTVLALFCGLAWCANRWRRLVIDLETRTVVDQLFAVSWLPSDRIPLASFDGLAITSYKHPVADTGSEVTLWQVVLVGNNRSLLLERGLSSEQAAEQRGALVSAFIGPPFRCPALDRYQVIAGTSPPRA